ncbi:MAG TPA: hypothetical protein VK149_10690 [Sideroxyarcus sp.]|nr:hypothetical protein [Sideroxyarcus sp.]
MNPFELQKQRELFFSDTPADQTEQAYLLLSGLENFHVEKGTQTNSLLIRYSVQHYSLEALEKALLREGFRLKDSLLGKVKKQLIHYCEDVQYHNLKTPEHTTKKTPPEIFVKVYEHHPHGNHDDTPKELRELK